MVSREFSPRSRLQFNITHSESFVACAVSDGIEVGIDVEPVCRIPPFEILGTHFSETERRWIEGLPRVDRAAGLLRLWTLKEAFIKATGKGLDQPLSSFTFEFDPLRVIFHHHELGNENTWRFEQRELRSHFLTVAWQTNSPESWLNLCEVSLETLLALTYGRDQQYSEITRICS